MTAQSGDGAKVALRHAGSTVRDHAPTGNRMYMGNTQAASGPKRSCGRCLTHQAPTGGKPSRRYGGWVCAGCAEVLGLGVAK